MGLYYNPNPPFTGPQQPLDQRKLTPPQSGPPPTNPPFRGSRVGQETLNCWAVAVATAAVAIILPSLFVPQPVAAAQPLFKKTNYEIYRAWDAPAPLPITAINLDPPIGAPSNPPFSGTRVPLEIQVAWIPPPFAPNVAINLDPPIAGPVVQNPPIVGAQVPLAVQIAWLPAPPAPIVAVNLKPPQSAPLNPPFLGTKVPAEVLAWAPTTWAPIVGACLPQAPAVAQNPPFNGGARVSTEILIGWLPPVPAPITGPKFTAGVTSTNPQFVGGARVPLEVLIGWLPLAPTPIVGPKFTVGAPTVVSQPPPVALSQAILAAWQIVPAAVVSAQNLTPPSAPAVFPFAGSIVPSATFAWYGAPSPAPQAQSFVAQPAVAAFPFTGSVIPAPTFNWWAAGQPQPQVLQQTFFTPSAPPSSLFAGASIPAPTQAWWTVSAALPQSQARFIPPVAAFPFTGARVPREVLRSWDAESQPIVTRPLLRISAQGPSAPPLGGGALIPQSILVRWIPVIPAPIVTIPVPPPSAPFIPSPRVGNTAPEARSADAAPELRSGDASASARSVDAAAPDRVGTDNSPIRSSDTEGAT